ncbi:hypothetical protein HRbin34_00288 [bacterium HR34]|nr:hypothetical protein HRbin34_00288 [bacterium HR34]
MVEVLWHPQKEVVIKKYQEVLDKTLEEFLKGNEGVLLMLSGGSALEAISNFKPKNLSPKITITVLDERYTFDRNLSNYYQLTKTDFFSEAIMNSCTFINPVLKQNESIQRTSERFNLELLKWLNLHPNGKIVATQGIGEDGHTAGIINISDMPKVIQQMFYDEKKFVVNYKPKKDHVNLDGRITVNFTFLKKIDKSLVFACGKNKKDILEKVLFKETDKNKYPALIIHEMKDVKVFTDQEIKNIE